jgi:alpha-ketoglutarate-dependent taurine dioxygenase
MDFDAHFINTKELPLVIEPKNKNINLNESLNLISSNKNYFKEAILKYGGILFRNFPIENEKDFSSLITHLDTGKFINYIGGDSPRNKIIDGVYTSTEAPPSVKILLHNELSFVNKHPKHIYFYCQIAPVAKGETIIADARKIYRDVDPSVKGRFKEKGLKYISRYFYKNDFMKFIAQNAHKSWIDVFETENKEEVEKLCKENDFEMKWNKNDWIEISQTRPATMNHPITQEPIWFNQAHLYDFNPKFLGLWKYLGTKLFYFRRYTKLHDVYHADGSKISKKDLYHVIDVLEKNTIAFPWQKGDVMVLDNVLSMHGRETFSGKRRVLTAMTG